MSKKPNLLFFGIDSLRRDHMSLYGYKRLTTPHIDKYVAGGIAFDNCFSALGELHLFAADAGVGRAFVCNRNGFDVVKLIRAAGAVAVGLVKSLHINGLSGFDQISVAGGK